MSAPALRHLVLGTAGHVDHGKTALVKALTGIDTDRLKEEQLRGISIELGFAELRLDGDIVLGVVDVPGHERFVRQMVAGAGGVDLAVLIVAADEGVMPQTVEHLEILASLGVKGGVIVLTKADLVDEEIAAVAGEEVRDLARGTFLESAPLVAVSSVTGAGLPELRRLLREQAERVPPRTRTGPFRLPVDRVFTLPGVGVVVTGTCWSGAVAPGDILTAEPEGLKVRVREVQAHGAVVPEGGSGQRLALALHGVKKEDLTRGDQIVTPQAVTPGTRLDARVTLVPHWQGTLRNRQRLHVHHAGREVLGRVLLLDRDELGGDDTSAPRTGLVQFVLEAPLMALPDDCFVLRFYSPVTTVAGGRV
ncbi:MAG: selenocysteine-specific translation elongation factor, partial [Candidatus Krumholzibacteriia bacterium]